MSLLPIIQSNAEYDLQKSLPMLSTAKLPVKYISIIWEAYRDRGICSFLMNFDIDSLFFDLQRSASTYLHYLTSCVSDSEKVTSTAHPFFYAIICEDWKIAYDIVNASRLTHNKNEEYYDDFLYVYYLMQRFFLDSTHQEQINTLIKYEENLSDQPDPRFYLCKAIHECNAGDFLEAFEELLELKVEKLTSRYNDGLIPEEAWEIERPIALEAIALLKLGIKSGLTFDDSDIEFETLPAALLQTPSQQYVIDSWRQG